MKNTQDEPELHCFSIDCPERTGGKCNADDPKIFDLKAEIDTIIWYGMNRESQVLALEKLITTTIKQAKEAAHEEGFKFGVKIGRRAERTELLSKLKDEQPRAAGDLDSDYYMGRASGYQEAVDQVQALLKEDI